MKINKEKHIGRVLFIVEGSQYEFSMLRKIFCNIMQYEYVEKRRNKPAAFVSKNDSHSRVAVVNTKESNIADITENEDYLDAVFDMLRKQYKFPVDKSAIYYLFDRDPKSNVDSNKIENYIKTLKNPYENDNAMKAGQLLLSYPSIEGYTVSSFRTNSFLICRNLGKDMKEYITNNTDIQLNKLSEETMLNATSEFIEYLKSENLEWDVDDFEPTSSEIFKRQEERYLENKGFRIFSMLTLAFLQMGIIEW
ncbi:MAG: hypothetical protein NC293_10845 [Roseburia sp.]|nr:hypothetical protein [Roseburia sp.]